MFLHNVYVDQREKFPFLKCASGNRALNFMGNFRETFGNFLETVRVVIGQESVRVGMWSLFDIITNFIIQSEHN